jgi:hypothetical protein
MEPPFTRLWALDLSGTPWSLLEAFGNLNQL